ncbi:MAG: TonB-dependent receptor [Pseudomonadota bacterium]
MKAEREAAMTGQGAPQAGRRGHKLPCAVHGILILVLGFFALAEPGFAQPGFAAAACVGGGDVVAVDGVVTLREGGALRPLQVGDRVCPGAVVVTGADGRVELYIADSETVVGLAPNGEMQIAVTAAGAPGDTVTLYDGVLRFLSSVRQRFEVRSLEATAGIDGTEAVVALGAEGMLVAVREGAVQLSTVDAARSLQAGEAGLATAGDVRLLDRSAERALSPRLARLAVDPQGASDWAIHFPPLALAGADTRLRAAARALEASDPDRARALTVEARTAARASGNAEALARAEALASIVAFARGRPDEAIASADAAVAAAPDLAAAQIAASYGAQARGNLRAAERAAERAADLDIDDPFTAARAAEVALLRGAVRQAGRRAERAMQRGPSALAEAVLGFVRLETSDYDAAAAAFQRAIAIDSEDPLPRLGQGVLAIRQGDVVEGRRALESAAALSPRLGSLRTWLGRAYAAEGLADKAQAQYALAQAADPDDPLPWLLAAEALFRENRPVEALAAVRAAEARGGQRATLRDERGLAEDRAVRAGAIGRLFQVLGFDKQAEDTAARAVEADAANAGAHGVLADSLRGRSRREIATLSAAFAQQVWRRPSSDTLDPARQEIDLALLDPVAVARPSFVELSPFFDQDGFSAVATGRLGTQGTRGGTLAATAKAGNVSVALGAMQDRTDGVVANNELETSIAMIEVRGQLTPLMDVFAEYRYRQTEAGDRTLAFDLTDTNQTLDTTLERNTARVGARWRLGADQDLATVLTFTRQDTELTTASFLGSQRSAQDASGLDWQAQHVWRGRGVGLVSGLAVAEADEAGALFASFAPFALQPVPLGEQSRQATAYSYATLDLGPRGVMPLPGAARASLTLGASVDHFDIERSSQGVRTRDTRFNPKIGLRLEPVPWVTMRGAWTQTVTPALVAQQRLEPQTVAGFAQVADQVAGVRVRQAGAGLEIRATPWLTFSGEYLRQRIAGPPGTVFAGAPDSKVREVRGAVDMLLINRVALSFAGEHIDAETPGASTELDLFRVTEATAQLAWFDPSGFFLSARAGYAFHRFVLGADSDTDSFPLLDFAAGYRLPEGRGVVSVEIRNAGDFDFGFYDRIALPQAEFAQPRYAREFSVIGRFTIGF